MGQFRRRLLLAGFFFVAWSSQLQAEKKNDNASRARAHAEAGQALYHLGSYSEALREFAAGYQIDPRPAFLIDMGQAYRQLGDFKNARAMYEHYLSVAPANAPNRADVAAVLRDLPTPVEPEVVPTVTAPSTPQATNVVVVAPPEHKEVSPPRRRWIWPVVAVAAAAVVAAVVVGVVVATSKDFGDQTRTMCAEMQGCVQLGGK